MPLDAITYAEPHYADTAEAPVETLQHRAGNILQALRDAHHALDRLMPADAPEQIVPKLPEEPGLEWLLNDGRNEANRLRERIGRLVHLVGRL